jgi:hypothetical protein
LAKNYGNAAAITLSSASIVLMWRVKAILICYLCSKKIASTQVIVKLPSRRVSGFCKLGFISPCKRR